MPRFNIVAILIALAFSVVCYQHAERSLYGRYLAQAMTTIHHRSLEQISREDLFAAAVQGMAGELDENSTFIPKRDAPNYREELNQSFVGIGVEVREDPDTGQVKFGNTIIGHPHPAWDAGFRPGDRIVAVGGQDATGWKLAQVVAAIRGPAGEPVKITATREGKLEPIEAQVVRSKIKVESVQGDYRGADKQWVYSLKCDPRISYVRLKTFGDQTAAELRSVLEELKSRGELNALIVDVRDNGGGYLDTAVQICDLFIDQGVIVTTRRRNAAIKDVREATKPGTFLGFPMVVLINRESASASEVFAACLQDHGRATLIGARTWGKGSVQEIIPVEGGASILKLTTASYWRPNEKNIHRLEDAKETDEWGVQPSEESFLIELNDEQVKRLRETRQAIDRFDPQQSPPEDAKTLEYDPALKRAVEYLEDKLDRSQPALKAA